MKRNNDIEQQLLQFYAPVMAQIDAREKAYMCLKSVIGNILSCMSEEEAQVMKYGSTASKTFLLHSDIDITIITKNSHALQQYHD